MKIDIIQDQLIRLGKRAEALAQAISKDGLDPLNRDDRTLIRQALHPDIQESMTMAEVFFLQGNYEKMDEAFAEAQYLISCIRL